mmetsp:Transcript_6913/g.15809  ORF Transcript_6913/g.15809 Transcript_6913/m.15809 type:complete len:224 (+) Transcript_6913:379-1050(+)
MLRPCVPLPHQEGNQRHPAHAQDGQQPRRTRVRRNDRAPPGGDPGVGYRHGRRPVRGDKDWGRIFCICRRLRRPEGVLDRASRRVEGRAQRGGAQPARCDGCREERRARPAPASWRWRGGDGGVARAQRICVVRQRRRAVAVQGGGRGAGGDSAHALSELRRERHPHDDEAAIAARRRERVGRRLRRNGARRSHDGHRRKYGRDHGHEAARRLGAVRREGADD